MADGSMLKPGGIINPVPVPPSIDGSFGGSQMWTPDKLLCNSGCGIIAGLDAIMRLKGEDKITRDEYLKRFSRAAEFIRPIMLPGDHEPKMIFGQEYLGSIGVSASRFKKGIKRLAGEYGINVRARLVWFGRRKKLEEYLKAGIPVAVMISAPLNNVTLTDEAGNGNNIGFHWVTLTGMDEDCYYVSSWGSKNKISRANLRKPLVLSRFYAINYIK